tara:strand:- start:1733 stop:1963 length:231 start_codon:yes stop_codon:yes gene_type:complete
MSIINQIRDSNLGKHGATNITGIFEGVPQNVAASVRGYSTPQSSAPVPPYVNPIDITRDFLPQPTYLDFLKAANQI